MRAAREVYGTLSAWVEVARRGDVPVDSSVVEMLVAYGGNAPAAIHYKSVSVLQTALVAALSNESPHHADCRQFNRTTHAD